MTFLCCLKNRNKFHNLLSTSTKDTKVLNFRLKLQKIVPFLFSMLIFVEKKINLQQVFSEKICSVVYTLLLVALQNFNTNLASCTHFYIEVSLLCLIFPNFILKLKHLRKHFTKVLIPQNLLTNVLQNLLIIYLFKNLFLLPFQNWNIE